VPLPAGAGERRRTTVIAADEGEASEDCVGIRGADIAAKRAVVEARGFHRVDRIIARGHIDQRRGVLVDLRFADGVEARSRNHIAREDGADGACAIRLARVVSGSKTPRAPKLPWRSGSSGTVFGGSCGAADVAALVCSEPPHAILLDRPARRASPLMLNEERLGGIRGLKVVSGVEGAVAQELEGGAVDFVSTAACDHVDDSAGGGADSAEKLAV